MSIDEQKVHHINNIDSLLSLLRDDLNWQLPEAGVEDITFEWTGIELNLSEDIHNKLRDGVIRQLQPFSKDQPWGIFMIDFAFHFTYLEYQPLFPSHTENYKGYYTRLQQNPGHLFIVDSGYNRIHIWRNIQDALAGKAADVILGANLNKSRPEIGRNTFFSPAAISFDGNYLWVGETKFSMRVLRFSPSP